MLKFLQLIRFPNLVMIALTQFLFFYYWIVPFDDCYIKIDLFSCVVLATILIAAGGNIINDFFARLGSRACRLDGRLSFSIYLPSGNQHLVPFTQARDFFC